MNRFRKIGTYFKLDVDGNGVLSGLAGIVDAPSGSADDDGNDYGQEDYGNDYGND